MKTRYHTSISGCAIVFGLLSTACSARELNELDRVEPTEREATDPRDRYTTTPQKVAPGFSGDAPADEVIEPDDRPREFDWPPAGFGQKDPQGK